MIRYLLLALILPVSILPMPVLHRLSEALAFIVYRVGGYRKKVVRANLVRAFPEKHLSEILRIEREFYLHLCDLIFESLKTFTISVAEFERRFVFKTPDTARQLADRNLTGISSHYNNWEWCALGLSMKVPHIPFCVYKPLNSKSWDDLFFKSRTRFGVRMIPIRAIREVITTTHDRPLLLGLLSDQAPHDYEKAFEVQFLHQQTFVSPGPAVITVQRGYTPIWGWVRKTGRSQYEWGIEEIRISDAQIADAMRDSAQIERIERAHGLSADQAAYGLALSREYTARLEHEIKMAPQFWLWSHRRWKSR